jgi:hypothetical protein
MNCNNRQNGGFLGHKMKTRCRNIRDVPKSGVEEFKGAFLDPRVFLIDAYMNRWKCLSFLDTFESILSFLQNKEAENGFLVRRVSWDGAQDAVNGAKNF